MKHYGLIFSFILLLHFHANGSERVITSKKVSQAPQIDGVAEPDIWSSINSTSVLDIVTNRTISLKSIHTDDTVYFLAQFSDESENREHRPMFWDAKSKLYVNGPQREDVFVFKWDMFGTGSGLSLSENRPYKADVWYWKAMRTDPLGYADDKIQIYSKRKTQNSKMMISKNGRPYFLSRKGDSGTASYRTVLSVKTGTPKIQKYANQPPSGSRADIKASGQWNNKQWTIEFARKLNTGHDDDIQFEGGGKYRFGVSLLEIAGHKPDSTTGKPLFGSGKISEVLILNIEK